MRNRLPRISEKTATSIISSLSNQIPGLKDVKHEAMAALHRPDGFEMPPPPFTWFRAVGSSFSYAQYNQILEKWFGDNFHTSPPPPFVDSLPDKVCAKYTDQVMLAQTEQLRHVTLTLFHMLRRTDIASGPQGKARMAKWLAMSEQEQLTTKNLCANGGKGMMKLLLDCITMPLGLPPTEFPLVGNDDWDRLFRVNKFEPDVPLSRQKRAYVQHCLAWRHKGLFSFCLRWIQVMDGQGDFPLGNRAPEVLPLNESTAPSLAASVSKREFAEMQERAQVFKPQTPECAYCHNREGGAEKIHLLCCSRCKSGPDGGRSVYYCSPACQKGHFPFHKTVCGTAAGSHPGTTSTPSPEVARHPEQALDPSSPLLSMGDPKSVRVICDPDGQVVFSSTTFCGEQLPIPPEYLWYVIGAEGWEPAQRKKDGAKKTPESAEAGSQSPATVPGGLPEKLAKLDLKE
ncbi:hypothetical protein JCM6882_004316 [Rhodosporidiobolus microsporus]